MPTLKAILNGFIDETQIGVHGTGTFAATTLTDTTELQNSNYQGNEYLNWWVNQVDSATAADHAKPVATNGLVPTTGVVTISGSNFATTGASKDYTLTRPDWHPTRYLIPLANRALQKAWQWWRAPITPVPDGDAENTGSVGTYWTGTSATPTYETTIVWGGKQSLKVTNSGANGYAQSNSFQVAPSRSFRVTVKAYATAGKPIVTLYDVTNSAVIATTTSNAPGGMSAWEDIMVTGAIPATCFRAALRVGGTLSSSVSYFDDMTVYWDTLTQVDLPAWLTQWRTEEGEEAARIYFARNRLGSNDDWAAKSYDLQMVDPSDYQVIQQPSAVNPLQVEFGRAVMSWSLWPLILEARRPFSDFGTLAAGTDTTSCPLRLAVAAMKVLAANERTLPHRSKEFGGDGLWEHEFVREQRRVASALNTPVADSYGLAWQTLG